MYANASGLNQTTGDAVNSRRCKTIHFIILYGGVHP